MGFDELDKKKALNVLYQVCNFDIDKLTKMATLASSLEPLNGFWWKLDMKQVLNILEQYH